MKKFVIMTAAFGMMAAAAQAQACDTLSGTLSTMTLTPNKSYVLQGVVVVPNTAVLTIQPGVTICAMADAGLVIAQGGQLQAIGKADSLITFTSIKAPSLRAPGDWRGIAVMGKADNNYVDLGGGQIPISRNTTFYGGETTPIDTDNSGTLAYMSIEYAGQNYSTDDYRSALLLNSVGSGTNMHHIQILNPKNNGLIALGGKFEVSDLYIQNVEHHDIEINYGYRGELKDLLAIKNPLMQTFASTTKGIFVSNNPNNPSFRPLTNPTIDAFTLIGPQQCSTDPSDFSTGIYFDKNGGGTFRNGVVSGFNTGLWINDEASAKRTIDATLNLSYVSLVNNSTDFANSSSFLWNDVNMCDINIASWIANNLCGSSERVQIGLYELEYNTSICENFCENSPIFSLGSSSLLQERIDEVLKVGALQEEPVFTWVQACPTAGCCESPSPKAYKMLGLYPNPATHTVQLEAIATQDAQVRLQVMDKATGRILYQTTTTPDATRSIDLQSYPIGQYLIQVFTTEAAYQASVQKNH